MRCGIFPEGTLLQCGALEGWGVSNPALVGAEVELVHFITGTWIGSGSGHDGSSAQQAVLYYPVVHVG